MGASFNEQGKTGREAAHFGGIGTARALFERKHIVSRYVFPSIYWEGTARCMSELGLPSTSLSFVLQINAFCVLTLPLRMFTPAVAIRTSRLYILLGVMTLVDNSPLPSQ